MNFRDCGCQFTDSVGKSVDWQPHSQNSGEGPATAIIRTGARHLLLNLSGCLGTRSNEGPVLQMCKK